jgi:two-component system chemotaxis response regulator CheB
VTPIPSIGGYAWHPSVDALVASALDVYPAPSVIGVLLTGMGDDGATAMARVRKAGGRTIAESEESCTVFGMPKELIERGGASTVLPADRVASQVVSWLRQA